MLLSCKFKTWTGILRIRPVSRPPALVHPLLENPAHSLMVSCLIVPDLSHVHSDIIWNDKSCKTKPHHMFSFQNPVNAGIGSCLIVSDHQTLTHSHWEVALQTPGGVLLHESPFFLRSCFTKGMRGVSRLQPFFNSVLVRLLYFESSSTFVLFPHPSPHLFFISRKPRSPHISVWSPAS